MSVFRPNPCCSEGEKIRIQRPHAGAEGRHALSPSPEQNVGWGEEELLPSLPLGHGNQYLGGGNKLKII